MIFFSYLNPTMFAARNAFAFMLVLFMTLQISYFSFCQNPSSQNNDLEKKLSAEHASVNSGVTEMTALLNSKDSLQAASQLNDLEKKMGSSSDYFNARFFLIKAEWLSRYAPASES